MSNDAAHPPPIEPSRTPGRPKKKRLILSTLWGAGIGAAVAFLLLVFWAGLVFLRATYSSVDVGSSQDPAAIVTQFLWGFVCVGPPFLLFCTFLGGAVGLVRSRF